MKTVQQIRDSFRDFFAERGHERVPSSSLVPAGDPTLMFVNSGMVQFKDVFTGQERRPYTRATSAQKCMRVSGKHNDLEAVGVSARHQTFFEMLGNFSFGDYFKEEAIVYAWEYLDGVLGIDKRRLLVSVFGGEGELAADDEAAALWRKVAGFPEERIVRLGKEDNFWQMGDTGPCGPCTEIYYHFGEGEPDPARVGEEQDERGQGWVELWNLVFMQFERFADGRMEPLPAPSIDTGMGLERATCAVQGVLRTYDTDVLRPLVELAASIAGKPYTAGQGPDDISMRVLADHARATAFLIADGVFPDREGRPYVLRRVMRRAIRHGHRLGIERPFFHECTQKVVELMGGEYTELRERQALIADIVQQEEQRFRKNLKRGLDRLSEYALGEQRRLPGDAAFELYDTYGFPLDLQEVIGREQGFAIDVSGFERRLREAQEASRGSKLAEAAVEGIYKALADELPPATFLGYDSERGESEILCLLCGGARVDSLGPGERGELIVARTPFYAEAGGQVGDQGTVRAQGAVFDVQDTVKPRDGLFVHRGLMREGSLRVGDAVTLEVDHARREATRRNHSATHLMHLALRRVVGPQATQKGSLVSPDRLRFDYSGAHPLSAEQIAEIEDLVTERILQNAEVTTDVLPMAEAKQRGAIGIFEEKYGDVVRMLTIADSMELCGGTHVRRTGDIGAFKILSDSGIAAGVRRIEAATGMNALRHSRALERELSRAAELLKATPADLLPKLQRALERSREQARELDKLKRQLIAGGSGDLTAEARAIDGVQVLGAQVDIADPKALRELADRLRDKMAPAVVALGAATPDGKALLVCTVSRELTQRLRAGELVKQMASRVGGGGGGRPDFAQAGGSQPEQLGDAVGGIYDLVRAALG